MPRCGYVRKVVTLDVREDCTSRCEDARRRTLINVTVTQWITVIFLQFLHILPTLLKYLYVYYKLSFACSERISRSRYNRSSIKLSLLAPVCSTISRFTAILLPRERTSALQCRQIPCVIIILCEQATSYSDNALAISAACQVFKGCLILNIGFAACFRNTVVNVFLDIKICTSEARYI